MNVDVGSGDVQVAAQNELAPLLVQPLHPRRELAPGNSTWFHDPSLPFGTYTRSDERACRVSLHDAGFHVELGVRLNAGSASNRLFLMCSDTPE